MNHLYVKHKVNVKKWPVQFLRAGVDQPPNSLKPDQFHFTNI